MDPRKLEAELNRSEQHITAVMPVHFAGWEDEGELMGELCENAGIAMIEDAAHSYPARRTDRPDLAQGTRGRIGVYSFYANKTMTTGEGGMLITADEHLAQRVARYRLHGINRDVWNRYTSNSSGYAYDIDMLGFKYNMPDILAAIGRIQLKKAAQFLNARQSIARRYALAFADRDWISPPPGSDSLETAEANTHSWHIYSLRLDLQKLDISRDGFIEALSARGIGTSVHFIPLHLMSYYRGILDLKPEDFPNALASFEATISLPIFPSLEDHQVQRIIEEVLKIGDTHYRTR